MKHTAIAAAVMLGLTVSANAQQPQPQPTNFASALDVVKTLPCNAFKQNPDESWTPVVTVVIGGANISGITFKNSPEATILDQRCSAKK